MKSVNKVKKTISINDYNKKIDEIIATGKPVNEQLVDMLTMLGGKIIDCTPVERHSNKKHSTGKVKSNL